MSEKIKTTLIKQSSPHREDLKRHFPTSDYQLISISSTISKGIVSLKQQCPHVLILGLQLDDGDGVKVIEHITTNLMHFKNLVYILILSQFLDQYIEKYIQKILLYTPIKCYFFCKNEDYYSAKAILNRLAIVKNSIGSIESLPTKLPIHSLRVAIHNKLDIFGISRGNKYRECLMRAMEEIIIEDLHNFRIEDIYDRVAMSFDCDFEVASLESIRKGIKYLIDKSFEENPQAFVRYQNLTGKKTPTNKTFIKYLCNSIREEYSELLP